MTIKDVFNVGAIMEWEDKPKSIAVLDGNNCKIMSKAMNNKNIIFHMQREGDGSEGNVFVKLKENGKDFLVLKKLFASKKVIGISLNEFKKFEIAEL